MNPSALIEWLGEGGTPVDAERAHLRADICARCPQHRGTKLWEQLTTHPAAVKIKEWLEHKHELKLETPRDSELGVCNACRCACELKVWTPIKHILSHAPPAEAHHESCWIRKEHQ